MYHVFSASGSGIVEGIVEGIRGFSNVRPSKLNMTYGCPPLLWLLISTPKKNQAVPIEMVISDLFRMSKMFIAFVSLCDKSPKGRGKP